MFMLIGRLIGALFAWRFILWFVTFVGGVFLLTGWPLAPMLIKWQESDYDKERDRCIAAKVISETSCYSWRFRVESSSNKSNPVTFVTPEGKEIYFKEFPRWRE